MIKPLTNVILSQTTATDCTRKLLLNYGIPADLVKRFTEKSLKIAGVTGLLDTGEPLENVALAGRWKATGTPLYYRNTSYKFRRKKKKEKNCWQFSAQFQPLFVTMQHIL